MRDQQKKSVVDKANFDNLRKLPAITVPKLTSDNYDIFTLGFCSIVGRSIDMNGIPIGHVMRGVTRNYDYPWTNREDKLKNCLLHTGDSFNNESIILYLIFLSTVAPKVLVSILSTHSILQRKVANFTRTLSYTFGMMLN